MAGVKTGTGQTALITGASVGIGEELAECFAKDGYDVILAARSEATLKNVADRIAKTHGVKATPIAADLGVQGGGAILAADIAARGLSVDVVVNNAGYGMAGGFQHSDIKQQLGMIDLNVRALAELTHIYWGNMLAKKRGGVLNVASTAAFQPGPYMAIYYATKAFVMSFSEALWKEAQGTGVHVTCLCPGPTESKFHDRAGTEKVRLIKFARMMTSKAVAEIGYAAFKANKRVAISGAQNAIMAKSVAFTPRPVVLGLVSYLQKMAM
jgi:uncharacterized protein